MSRVSVIIQSHNRPQGLKRALQSLQMQTFAEFEVLISDDSASAAEIQEVVSGPAAAGLHIDMRHTGPCGAAESMREAFGRSSCEYIKVLHDDDWLTPHSLEQQVAALDGNPDSNVVYGQALISYGDRDQLFYVFENKAIKVPSAQWIARYENTGGGLIQSPVTALYRRNERFRIVWDEYVNPLLREAARKTGAGTDLNLQIDNAGSNRYVVLLPRVVCFFGTDMKSVTQTDPKILSYYEMWKKEYDSHPPWRY
jgi:glycosyltransferase involved in cell wall biosynthesis